MAALIGSGLVGFAMFLAACAQTPDELQADFVFENVNLVPMHSNDVLFNRTVAVKNGKILAILTGDQKSVSGHRIDGKDHYMLPGLADMHIHLRMKPQAMFNLFLANGVTTVMNMRLADGGVDHVQLRKQVENGILHGPRYLISGPMLRPEIVPDVASVAPILDRHIEHHYDAVKIHEDLPPAVYEAVIKGARSRGLRVVGHAQRALPLAESLRMNALEHMEEFLYVSTDGFGEAASASLDDFLEAYMENLERLQDPAYRNSLAELVASSDIYLDPTLGVYHSLHRYLSDTEFEELQSGPHVKYLPKATRDEYLRQDSNPYRQELPALFGPLLDEETSVAEHFARNAQLLETLLLELHMAGVPLLLGTDSFGAMVPGFSVHEELELLVEAGLTPYEALQAATVNVASYLGEQGTSGTLEEGKKADFILVKDNPLLDIRSTRMLTGVYTQSKWYGEDDLRRILAEAAPRR